MHTYLFSLRITENKGKLEEKSILYYKNRLLQVLGFIALNLHLHCN